MIPDHERKLFLEAVWGYYRDYGRHDLPWRQPEPDGKFDPYKIMVSEVMLQQTQVPRVMPKYVEFIGRFPSTRALAGVELGEVLRAWQGLGYNRRAKFLWQAAQEVAASSGFPTTYAELVKLPGIGPNTAGAILAYAYDQPTVFIETNIRTVYIYHFMQDYTEVDDKEILELLRKTLDYEHPREFYWALMDYGSHLKATVGNLNKASRHYAKQSAFSGSRRQVRGAVLRALGGGTQTLAELQETVSDERLAGVLADLVTEGLIRTERDTYSL